MANGKALTQGIFQGKVLAKLENIGKNQEQHNEMFKDVYKRINKNENEIIAAKNFAKGAMVVGSGGFLSGAIGWFKGLI